MAQDSRRSARWVSAGILLSRLSGLVRTTLQAKYLGTGPAADAWSAAFRIANFIQNLLGEGALSASFIPVYAGLRSEGKTDEARAVARGVLSALLLVVGLTVGFGLLASQWLVRLIAPGLSPDSQTFAVSLVRILFPATGALVLSAFCLGVLNSHRKFFLPYAAPVVWNACIIFAVVWGAATQTDLNAIVTFMAWGTVAGSVLQCVVQWPSVNAAVGGAFPSWTWNASVRQVFLSFVPAVSSRGVVQVSSFLDTAFASMVAERALSTLQTVQTIAILPVSLFGVAVSAAELPELSAEASGDRAAANEAIRLRLARALERVAFFIAPCAAGFFFVGDVVVAAFFEYGRFSAEDSRLGGLVLVAVSFGLWPQTTGRLYASAFFALKDTRTPFRTALVRLSAGAALAWLLALVVPGTMAWPAQAGTAGLALASSVAAAVETWFLRNRLEAQVGSSRLSWARAGKVWGSAGAAGALALSTKVAFSAAVGARVVNEWTGAYFPPPQVHALAVAAACAFTFAVVYALATRALKVWP